MKLVILESPYAPSFNYTTEANVRYARKCLTDCLRREEAPLASHLLYTQEGVLDDTKPEERALGLKAGHAWYDAADACVVYVDQGVSKGMVIGVNAAKAAGVVVIFRSLDGDRQLVEAALKEFST